MPRKQKKPSEWTTEEVMKKLFPKKVRDELHKVAHEKDDPNEKKDDEQPSQS